MNNKKFNSLLFLGFILLSVMMFVNISCDKSITDNENSSEIKITGCKTFTQYGLTFTMPSSIGSGTGFGPFYWEHKGTTYSYYVVYKNGCITSVKAN